MDFQEHTTNASLADGQPTETNYTFFADPQVQHQPYTTRAMQNGVVDTQEILSPSPTPSVWDKNTPGQSTAPSNSSEDLTILTPETPGRQRTAQACDKCRERKTKCSGERPLCQRCATRGLICQYSCREPRVRGQSKPRAKKRISFADIVEASSAGTHNITSYPLLSARLARPAQNVATLTEPRGTQVQRHNESVYPNPFRADASLIFPPYQFQTELPGKNANTSNLPKQSHSGDLHQYTQNRPPYDRAFVQGSDQAAGRFVASSASDLIDISLDPISPHGFYSRPLVQEPQSYYSVWNALSDSSSGSSSQSDSSSSVLHSGGSSSQFSSRPPSSGGVASPSFATYPYDDAGVMVAAVAAASAAAHSPNLIINSNENGVHLHHHPHPRHRPHPKERRNFADLVVPQDILDHSSKFALSLYNSSRGGGGSIPESNVGLLNHSHSPSLHDMGTPLALQQHIDGTGIDGTGSAHLGSKEQGVFWHLFEQ